MLYLRWSIVKVHICGKKAFVRDFRSLFLSYTYWINIYCWLYLFSKLRLVALFKSLRHGNSFGSHFYFLNRSRFLINSNPPSHFDKIWQLSSLTPREFHKNVFRSLWDHATSHTISFKINVCWHALREYKFTYLTYIESSTQFATMSRE